MRQKVGFRAGDVRSLKKTITGILSGDDKKTNSGKPPFAFHSAQMSVFMVPPPPWAQING